MTDWKGTPPASWPLLAVIVALIAGAWGCSSAQPTVIKGNRYVMSGELAASQLQCTPASPSRKWAVVVGVNFYADDRIPDLGGAVNDAWTFYHYLASPQGGAVDPFRLKLLLNEEATRAGVEDALGEFLQYACPQDQIIIYFAGHGAPEPDRPEEAFLLVHDTNLDSMVSTAISMTQLPNFLKWRTGQTGRLLMLIDACHSGNIQFPGKRGFKPTEKDIKLEVDERAQSVNKSLDSLVAGNDGWGAISATAADQLAGETSASCILGGKPYAGGIFTCFLLEGLAGAADEDKNNDVTLGEVFEHLVNRVSDARDGDQVPQMSGQLDSAVVLSNPRGMAIDIPEVPEKYLVETLDKPLRPYIWGAAGLTVLALGASAFFHLQTELAADDINSFDNVTRDQSELTSLKDEHDANKTIAIIGYLSTAALATITLSALSWDLLDEPEGIDDVYERGPVFQLTVGPTPALDGAAVHLSVDY